MENQHRKINGYRELSQEEIDLMNEIKVFGPQLESVIEKVKALTRKQESSLREMYETGQTTAEELQLHNCLNKSDPGRWTEIAQTNLQQGLMALTRAVAKPTFF